MSELIAEFLTKDQNVRFVSGFNEEEKIEEKKVASVSNLFSKPLVKLSVLTSLTVFVIL